MPTQYEYSPTYQPEPRRFIKELLDAAAEPYRSADWYAWFFAKTKLRLDPAFVTILKHGLIPDGSQILDLGCGQGLLASTLLAAQSLYANGRWPQEWPRPSAYESFTGIDSVPLDIERAMNAVGHAAHFSVADIGTVEFVKADAIVILDVLHYMDFRAQEDVLKKVHGALTENGRLILRVGNAAGGIWFKLSYWYDRFIWFLRVRKDNPLYCRSLDEWLEILDSIGFETSQIPLGSGVSLANVFIAATKRR